MKTMLWIVLSTCVHHDFPLSATMELPDTATQVCTKGAVIMSLTSFEETQLFISIPVFLCILHFLRLWVLTLCAVFFQQPFFAHGKTPNWFRETRCVWMSARTRKEKNKTKKKLLLQQLFQLCSSELFFFSFPRSPGTEIKCNMILMH